MRTELTDRYRQALTYAAEIHKDQHRKGPEEIPYVSHLLAVSSLVIENRGTEDEAIAALLHDAVEDRKATLEEIRGRFGEDVATIVRGCTDSDAMPKPPWKERKLAYLAHLRDATRSVRLVAAADKLHNARCILANYRAVGDEVWDRFGAPKTEVLWYYQELTTALRRPEPQAGDALVEELERVVSEIQRMATEGSETQD